MTLKEQLAQGERDAKSLRAMQAMEISLRAENARLRAAINDCYALIAATTEPRFDGVVAINIGQACNVLEGVGAQRAPWQPLSAAPETN